MTNENNNKDTWPFNNYDEANKYWQRKFNAQLHLILEYRNAIFNISINHNEAEEVKRICSEALNEQFGKEFNQQR